MVVPKENQTLDRWHNNFEKNGWKVFREEVPDQCKNWEYPWAVDMIVYNQRLDLYIGVEGKRISTQNGSKIAEAIEQIYRYKELTYFDGRKIDLWAFIGFREKNDDGTFDNISIFRVVKTLLNKFGIGIGYDVGSCIEFANIDKKFRVDISGNPDMDLGAIKKRMNQNMNGEKTLISRKYVQQIRKINLN